MTVIVVTRWPGLVDAIKRAGHEPVVIVEESEPDKHPAIRDILLEPVQPEWIRTHIDGTFKPE
jgi:hypothetical protein